MAKIVSFVFFFATVSLAQGGQVALTIDDPRVDRMPLFSAHDRNQKILEVLKSQKVRAVLFVSGKNIDNKDGTALLKTWDKAGHWIANHTYSHLHYHSKKLTADEFVADAFRVEPLISGLNNFRKLFRFPMLKEGDTAEKRDRMRIELEGRGYKQGYVTIDASDWYIDQRLRTRLRINPSADTIPYRNFYLRHIWDRTQYYDGLATKVFGRQIKHTLLIHHNLLNALFLRDLLQGFKGKGWTFISPEEAYQDPVFALSPNILPAGEGIVWASAKETGKFENELRYPAEDGEYEKEEMDRLGL